MAVKRILHPCISVPDMEEAITFFRDILGFKVVDDAFFRTDEIAPFVGDPDAVCRSVVIHCPDESEIELFGFEHPKGKQTATNRFEDVGVSAITLVVDELDPMLEKLRAHGYTSIGTPSMFDGNEYDLRGVHIRGPAGVPLNLCEEVPNQKRG